MNFSGAKFNYSSDVYICVCMCVFVNKVKVNAYVIW